MSLHFSSLVNPADLKVAGENYEKIRIRRCQCPAGLERCMGPEDCQRRERRHTVHRFVGQGRGVCQDTQRHHLALENDTSTEVSKETKGEATDLPCNEAEHSEENGLHDPCEQARRRNMTDERKLACTRVRAVAWCVGHRLADDWGAMILAAILRAKSFIDLCPHGRHDDNARTTGHETLSKALAGGPPTVVQGDTDGIGTVAAGVHAEGDSLASNGWWQESGKTKKQKVEFNNERTMLVQSFEGAWKRETEFHRNSASHGSP